MSSLTLTILLFTVLMFAVTGIFFRRRKKQLRTIADLEEIGREMAAEFQERMRVHVPDILRRPTSVVASVETFQEGWRFLPKRARILITITLSDLDDLETVQGRISRFVGEYMAEPGREGLKARVFFPQALQVVAA